MNTARLLGIAVVCVLASSEASARDLKTLNGEVFKNITITKQDPTGLQISHDDGVIFLDFRNLGPAEQKEFGYDPAAYAAAWKQKVEADKARREQAAAAQATRAKAQAATAAAQSSAPVPFPPYTPTNQTGIEYYYDSPGYPWGPYDYAGRGFSNRVPQTYYGGGVPFPHIPHPYYYGPTWGPTIIRQR